MEYDVQQINQVHEVVQAEPDEQCVLVDFSKTETEDDHPKVVQKGQGDHYGPVVAETTRRVKHERPVTPRNTTKELGLTLFGAKIVT